MDKFKVSSKYQGPLTSDMLTNLANQTDDQG